MLLSPCYAALIPVYQGTLQAFPDAGSSETTDICLLIALVHVDSTHVFSKVLC